MTYDDEVCIFSVLLNFQQLAKGSIFLISIVGFSIYFTFATLLLYCVVVSRLCGSVKMSKVAGSPSPPQPSIRTRRAQSSLRILDAKRPIQIIFFPVRQLLLVAC